MATGVVAAMRAKTAVSGETPAGGMPVSGNAAAGTAVAVAVAVAVGMGVSVGDGSEGDEGFGVLVGMGAGVSVGAGVLVGVGASMMVMGTSSFPPSISLLYQSTAPEIEASLTVLMVDISAVKTTVTSTLPNAGMSPNQVVRSVQVKTPVIVSMKSGGGTAVLN